MTAAEPNPTLALFLADEYGIRHWILALLDPEAITHGTSDPKKNIQSPPTYKTKDMVNGAGAGKGSKKSRASKAAPAASAESPTKKTPRKVATPRKPRTTKGRGKSTEPDANAINGAASPDRTVKVDVETESKPTSAGDEEVEKTKVNITMPSDHPDLELPNDAEGMLAKAREMVAEAEKISGAAPSTAKGKRKASELIDADEPGSPGGSSAPKRARTVDLELRKERIKRRALTGIAASLAIGYVLTSDTCYLNGLLTSLQSAGTRHHGRVRVVARVAFAAAVETHETQQIVRLPLFDERYQVLLEFCYYYGN